MRRKRCVRRWRCYHCKFCQSRLWAKCQYILFGKCSKLKYIPDVVVFHCIILTSYWSQIHYSKQGHTFKSQAQSMRIEILQRKARSCKGRHQHLKVATSYLMTRQTITCENCLPNIELHILKNNYYIFWETNF